MEREGMRKEDEGKPDMGMKWEGGELSRFSFSHAAKPACDGDASSPAPTRYQPTYRQGRQSGQRGKVSSAYPSVWHPSRLSQVPLSFLSRYVALSDCSPELALVAVRVLYWVSKFPKAAKELFTAITSDKVWN